jgi:hypothetical protein
MPDSCHVYVYAMHKTVHYNTSKLLIRHLCLICPLPFRFMEAVEFGGPIFALPSSGVLIAAGGPKEWVQKLLCSSCLKKKKKLGYPGLAQVTGGDQVVPLRNAST